LTAAGTVVNSGGNLYFDLGQAMTVTGEALTLDGGQHRVRTAGEEPDLARQFAGGLQRGEDVEDVAARATRTVVGRRLDDALEVLERELRVNGYEALADPDHRIHGLAADRAELDDIVRTSLDRAGLLKEVKDRMDEPGTGLSGGQQQRLCIARTIAVNPEVILMDEPCSALDPIATARIEDLIDELSRDYAIVIVTHSMQQAARVSRRVAYFHLGRLVEVDETDKIFTNPQHKLTEDYITGRIG